MVAPQLKKELDVIANDLLRKYLDGANSQIKAIFKEYRKYKDEFLIKLYR